MLQGNACTHKIWDPYVPNLIVYCQKFLLLCGKFSIKDGYRMRGAPIYVSIAVSLHGIYFRVMECLAMQTCSGKLLVLLANHRVSGPPICVGIAVPLHGIKFGLWPAWRAIGAGAGFLYAWLSIAP